MARRLLCGMGWDNLWTRATPCGLWGDGRGEIDRGSETDLAQGTLNCLATVFISNGRCVHDVVFGNSVLFRINLNTAPPHGAAEPRGPTLTPTLHDPRAVERAPRSLEHRTCARTVTAPGIDSRCMCMRM